MAVKSAAHGEINMAMKIGTCAINVAVNAGGRVTRRKLKYTWIIMPMAINNAVNTKSLVCSLVFKMTPPGGKFNIVALL